jgi:protein ImuB
MIACADVPALALQLVLRAHPDWQGDPVVVVEDDRPFALIVWANRTARAHAIHRGMSFAQAKALSAKLHAEVVAEHEIESAIDALFDRLLPFSPGIEPVLAEPGLFWLDPSGLDTLFGDLERWAAQVHDCLTRERYVSSVVVGHRRPSAFAIARVRNGPLVMRDPAEEQRLCGRVPLDRLGIGPRLQSDLALLGITRVGELLALPAAQLRIRYGEAAAHLHDFLSGRAWAPLMPRTPAEPSVVELEVEPPDDDHNRILFGLKSVLHRSVVRLRAEHQGITALDIELQLERLGQRRERIESAAPSLDVPQLIDLLRLRLANVALPARVEHIRMRIEHTRVHPRQLSIEHGKKPRDLEAASRAIARLRASFGPQAVTCARLREAYLPEGGYRYEPIREIRLPRAPATPAEWPPAELPLAELPLVRRVFPTPVALPSKPTHEPETWLGPHGAVVAMFGPYRIAGGWWTRRRERDYHFVETQQGELLWIYYDRTLRRWFLQGVVD